MIEKIGNRYEPGDDGFNPRFATVKMMSGVRSPECCLGNHSYVGSGWLERENEQQPGLRRGPVLRCLFTYLCRYLGTNVVARIECVLCLMEPLDD